ncbi:MULTISPECIES: hypothetical protein [unclassified Streptomyces]|uniref:hypothetical protein n=1 Tax=unclassified Streptomyces TaxID=2593676 RepID=UPI000DBA4EF4|nr:hypothetical protein [Streptomyces sp. PsTaAH-137]MYT73331.1 hypothetical protein [Streptomyces sp. SID8367]
MVPVLGPPLGVELGVVPGVDPGVDPGVVPGVVFDGEVLVGDVLDGDVDGSVDVGVPAWAAAGCWTCVRGSCPADGSCGLPWEGVCAEPGDCGPFVSWAAGALSEDVLMLCALSPDGAGDGVGVGVGEAVDVSAAARVSGPEWCCAPDAPSAPPVSVCAEVCAAGCCS